MRAQILAVLATALIVAPADAHRLNAQAFLLPGKQIRVESWFSGGEVPRGATVRVYGPANDLLTEGKLDEQGIWVFSFDQAAPTRIVISAGKGHQKELRLSAADLAEPQGTPSVVAVPLADRNAESPLKDVLVGIGFLMAMAAFVLSIRNGRRLRDLERNARKAEPQS
jgi:hypothetical protein